MINTLDKMYFSVTATPKLREGIDEIHNLLVVEILKVRPKTHKLHVHVHVHFTSINCMNVRIFCCA